MDVKELYLSSVKELKRLIKENKEITSEEWNDYAHKNILLSSITLISRASVKDFESLKDKYMPKRKKSIFLEIKKMRRKLDRSIVEKGLKDEQTRMYSDEMDLLINEYYKSKEIRDYPYSSKFIVYYEKSYRGLKKVTEEHNKYPNIFEWNQYAKENRCLSSISMQYISMLDWHKLRTKVLAELNAKI